ncbi:MAG: hypothetical protein JKY62_08150 [Desulfocapsa sp.]|uniref:Uncharacterized protein n=1 Tax=Desulfotalea psychrophila TaxID=84980 RepID=A0ABS3AWI1_9BACT|nr:hypothetical protein [Desulfocapsa sp.]MBN4068351.1 hypothetical protein [Desulfotalea psychrophila]
MNPSKEKKQKSPPAKPKSWLIPSILAALLVCAIGGFGFYYSDSKLPSQVQTAPEETAPRIPSPSEKKATNDTGKEFVDPFGQSASSVDIESDLLILAVSSEQTDVKSFEETGKPHIAQEVLQQKDSVPKNNSICDTSEKQLDAFYHHLDNQPYMAAYKFSPSSKAHFTELVTKLLANPPQVTRESDDLYTILKNTAHFFRVSGKNNILMMKGILDHEKASLEQILSDYYLLVTTPECSMTSYGNIDKDALYEYACFFLNTMGGRLYLFRRDSLSRMVVTYYAILLVDQANIQNNNRHGISLRPAVNMLISEMESGGYSLKGSEIYLDKLYNLKEKYQ